MEGSLIAILVSAAAGAVMLILAARRGLIVPPVWARNRRGAITASA